jgi:magnesium transporter
MSAHASTGFASLARAYLREFPDEVARHLEHHSPEEIARLTGREPLHHAVALLERIEADVASKALSKLRADFAAAIVSAMEPVRAVAILAWLNDGERSQLLGQLDTGPSRELRRMGDYPMETAGRLMDPRAVGFKRGTTAQQALTRLRSAGIRQIADLFLTDDDRRLTGRVPLQVIAVAAPATLLETLALPAVAVQDIAPSDEVVERFTSGRLASLPVVDFDGRFLGVIRYDALVTAAQQDAAADMQAMVGASRQERALSPVSFAVKKRLPWLEINLVTAFLAASVVGLFEGTIARFTALAVLMPVVAGQSGNTGAQALAVTMRGLAMREIRVGQWPRVLRKEAGVALLNGIAISLTTAGGVFLWSRSPGLAVVIGTSMVLSMLAAGTAGVLVPTVLTGLGQDPAQSSSIILTTVTDIVGFASFLGIATLLAGML